VSFENFTQREREYYKNLRLTVDLGDQ